MKWTEEQIRILKDGLKNDLPFGEIAKNVGKKTPATIQMARTLNLKRIRGTCPLCNKRKVQNHFNSKWCKPCALARRQRPYANLLPKQIEVIRRYNGKKSLFEIAKMIKSSKSVITRYRMHSGLSLRSDAYPQDLVKKVCEYYFVHGKVKTEKKFPKVKLRSIIERHYSKLGYPPRQLPWKANELIMLARMAGLISMENQAKYFNRPRANRGSIRSAWVKKFGSAGGQINGLSWVMARHYVKKPCYITTQFWWQRNHVTKNPHSRKIVLWIDLEKHLKDSVPDHLKQAIKALAKFQRWLHGRNAKANIKKMMETI